MMRPSTPGVPQRNALPPALHGCRVLVTGGAGFIGSRLVQSLMAYRACVGVVDDISIGSRENLATPIAHGLLEDDLITIDISDSQAVQRIASWEPEIVVHLAAQPRVVASVEDIRGDARTNILGTINVLEAARLAGSRRVVVSSSGGAVYGSLGRGQAPFSEVTDRKPISPYGLSKTAADSYIELYGGLAGIDSVILALGNVYGTRPDGRRTSGAIPNFLSALMAAERPVIFGDGGQTRDFVHVDDVVHAICLAIGAPGAAGQTINIASGIATSINEVFHLVRDATGSALEAQHVDRLPYEVEHVVLDVSRARDVLGWSAQVQLTQGVKSLVAESRTPQTAHMPSPTMQTR